MFLRLAVAAVLLTFPLVVHAQSGGGGGTGGGTSGLGSCSGSMAGTVGLAVPQSDGTFLSVNSSLVTSGVFGAAECQCASAPNNPDINVEIRLTTAIPPGMAAGAVGEIWLGDSSCMTPANRTSSTQTNCKKLANLSAQQFSTTQSSQPGGIHIPLPADFLTNPSMKSCDPAVAGDQTANGVWIFIFTDPNNPFGTCTLNLTQRMALPDPVTNPSASAGDGAVSITWTAPPLGTTAKNIQVLCSDDCGNPITTTPPKESYSICVNGTISRKDLTTGGGTTTGAVDGGTTTTTDLGASRISPGGAEPQITGGSDPPARSPNATPVCSSDMGVSDDMGTNNSLAAFMALDPRYICTDATGVSSPGTRISGLNNFQTYHFIVVTTDTWGNAAPSPVIDATPQPVEDLWRRYRDAGGGGGGCFIATAAFGSYENRWVYVLRDFRDQVLLEHDSGRSFVDWYYAHSPRAAAWIAGHGWARGLTRLALVPAIAGAWFWLYVPPWQKALLVTLLLAFCFRRRIAAAVRRTTA
jgi:hypothetical protein